MAIKLIGIDLDGTLLDSKGQISEENRLAVRYAMEKGVMPVINTGRMYATTRKFMDRIDLNTPAVVCNGAEIRDETQRFHRSVLDIGDIALGLETSRMFDAYPIMCDGHFMHTLKNSQDCIMDVFGEAYDELGFYRFHESAEDLLGVARMVGALKLVLISSDPPTLRRARTHLAAHGTGRFDVTSSFSHNVDMVKEGSNKGTGLLRLAERYGIRAEEIMAVGDHENDIPAFDVAGVSVAMGNAADETKAHAAYVTLSNDESGFAAAVRRFIK